MTSELADVTLERADGVALAAVSGELDMSNAASVRQQIAQFVTPNDRALVIDLSELTFMDSAGLHSIFELSDMLEERRQQLFLCVPPHGNVARTIDIVGLRNAVSVHSDRDAAIAAAQAQASEERPFPSEDA